MYIARKRKPEHLLFSLICGLVILDFLTDQITVLVNVPTTYIHWEVYLYRLIVILTSILFPAFFCYQFSFTRKGKFISFIVLCNLMIYFFFTNIWNVFNVLSITMLTQSSLIVFLALLKRREGSIITFGGILASFAAYFFDLPFAGLASIMVICTSFIIARQFGRSEKAEKEAQLKSTRLENELLKKHINPHFLMNTLTSIIVWLRKDPASAVKLIEALADEFRMITQISGLRQIPIRQEIDLCRTHLKIMNYRKGADFKLMTENVTDDGVPPMIFHTLVENGLTHGYENKTRGTFTLHRKLLSKGIQYILSNDGEFADGEKKASSGMGLQYVQARLEESYPGRWKMLSHKRDHGWEVVIEIGHG